MSRSRQAAGPPVTTPRPSTRGGGGETGRQQPEVAQARAIPAQLGHTGPSGAAAGGRASERAAPAALTPRSAAARHVRLGCVTSGPSPAGAESGSTRPGRSRVTVIALSSVAARAGTIAHRATADS